MYNTYIYMYLTKMTSMFTMQPLLFWVCFATGKLPVAHVQKLLRINGRHWVKKPPKAKGQVVSLDAGWFPVTNDLDCWKVTFQGYR